MIVKVAPTVQNKVISNLYIRRRYTRKIYVQDSYPIALFYVRSPLRDDRKKRDSESNTASHHDTDNRPKTSRQVRDFRLTAS